uniref:Uncharacterized protein ycf35 n=1 Tax=Lophocladia kuetzingii TaxID=675577 RepID=A0A1Z1MND1_9FLOR|nr:hypothetical protein [Lophocladia kuetzingii]ARW67568.1 hypothetical protein [Lophocladia kuetzingii]
MSHFSKIKTNIVNTIILEKTIKQLGFNYKYFNNTSLINDSSVSKLMKNMLVINPQDQNDLFSFIWNGQDYNLVVDLQLWSLNLDFNYFIDRLSQQYAYNLILDQSSTVGFQKISENISDDGSIKLTLQKW